MSQETTIAALESHFARLKPLVGRGTTELMANEDGSVSVDRNGRLHRTGTVIDAEARTSIIRLLAGYYGLVCNREYPSLAVPLPILGGGRVQALIPPLTAGPILSIRFPSRKRLSVEDLVRCGTLDEEQASLLSGWVRERRSILVAGGTGSGKTTIANAFLDTIRDERLVVIEDTPELKVRNRNTVYIRTEGSFTTREAVAASLRLRPDRIIVGEVRDGAGALDLCKAWLTGHPGGIGTIHASSVLAVKERLRSLMEEVVVTPSIGLIESAVERVVFVAKIAAGRRTVRKIIEIGTLKGEMST